MPVDEHNIGKSENTPIKHAHFQRYMELQVNIVKGLFSRRVKWDTKPYLYFDLNAGNGGTIAQPGSPVLAIAALNAAQIPYHAVLMDIKRDNTDELIELFGYNPNVHIHNTCNRKVLTTYLYENPFIPNDQLQWVYGCVFCDPNGPSGIRWDLLADFAAVYKRIDIVIHMAATTYKRVRIVHHPRPLLSDQLAKIGKGTTIVRKPNSKAGWTIIILSSWDRFPGYKKLGFHNANTEEGNAILEELTYTVEERDNQMILPGMEEWRS